MIGGSMTAYARRPPFTRAYARRPAIWFGAVLCLAPAASRAEDASPTRSPHAAEIVVTRAGRACFTGLIHASGYLVPRRTAVVMLPVPGYRITEVRANVGDMVKRGDVLARALPLEQTAADEQAPHPPPAKSPGPGGVDVKASASGMILQSTAFVGMPTSEKSKPLFTLAVDGEIEASVAVPGVHLAALKSGQTARLTLSDGGTIGAHVRRLPAVLDPATQMGSARLSLDAGQGLVPSRFVQATIETERTCGIGVPMGALRRTSAGTSVQIVKDDVIVDRSITLGPGDDTDTEATSGLTEGDVVVSGAGASRAGDRVTPVFPGSRTAR